MAAMIINFNKIYKYKEFKVRLGIIERVGKQGRSPTLADILVDV